VPSGICGVRLADRLAALRLPWIAALLVVAALDLAVVTARPADGPGGLRTAELAPLVAELPDAELVRDGVLVADDVAVTGATHAVAVAGGAIAADGTLPGGLPGLVLAGDGLALVSADARWTVPWAGDLRTDDLRVLLAGWEHAQRGPALGYAVLSGVLAATLSTAVLMVAVRLAGGTGRGRRPPRAPLPRPRVVIAWWAVSLAGASTCAAAVAAATTGRVAGTPALVTTCALATAAVGALAVTSARSPAPVVATPPPRGAAPPAPRPDTP
jgi:hypothetical protein